MRYPRTGMSPLTEHASLTWLAAVEPVRPAIIIGIGVLVALLSAALVLRCRGRRASVERVLPPEPALAVPAQVRGVAPGFLVGFARGFDMDGSGRPLVNRAQFPQVSAIDCVDATPELLVFVSELSAPAGRTVEEIVRVTAERTGARPERLRRFAAVLADAGHLVPGSPLPRWPEQPVLDVTRAGGVAATQRFEVPEGSGFLVDGGRFLWFDHGGTLGLRLTNDEMLAVQSFAEPCAPEQAWVEVARSRPSASRSWFDDLLGRLRLAGLLRPTNEDIRERTVLNATEKNARSLILAHVLDDVSEFEKTVMARPGLRAAVIPVNDDHHMAPLALGLLVAYAQELDGGRLRERYDFVPLFLAEEPTLLAWAQRPAVFLFSNYIWNVERNLQLSARLKQANPSSVTIHGGPSTPKYRSDCEQFFVENPHVDVTVRGEGEATLAAVLDALDPARLNDLSNLRGVAGLSFRDPSADVVHTEDRPRIADLDTIPSPYLLGLFEPFGRAHVAAVVESNRGCPYGCTFCDWGSATLSRIRKFDMGRVKNELEWLSRNELMFVALCDANFGVLERDVEIARYIAEMKKKYGYPKTAALNYAKNTMKHLRPIIKTFAGAGLTIEPTVALQTTDEPTLKVIRRSNIKLSQYDELADEFLRTNLPLATDIMMGLPGSTVTSFKADLQNCTDRDVRARCNQTVLLPNSPMNEPAYRAEHGIVAKPHDVIRETNTFTRAEWDEMDRLRVAFYAFDNFGVLRHMARFARSEVEVKEVDFYDRVSRIATAEPLEWPLLAGLVRMMWANMAPPSSWTLLVQEVGRYLVAHLGVEPGPALDTAIAIQAAHLPAADRTMPVTLDLPHDYVAWYTAVLEIRSNGHRDDWERFAPRLHTFGPGRITIGDPKDLCGTMVGKAIMVMAWTITGWELASPVARGQYERAGDPGLVDERRADDGGVAIRA
jgi:radical SAM superfamily enzyme YgiQ (UPF0313 family)